MNNTTEVFRFDRITPRRMQEMAGDGYVGIVDGDLQLVIMQKMEVFV
jgi:hypothetical protein